MERVIYILLLFVFSSCSMLNQKFGINLFGSNKLEVVSKLYLPETLYDYPLYSEDENLSSSSSLKKCLGEKRKEEVDSLYKELKEKGSKFETNYRLANCYLASNEIEKSFFFYDRALSQAKAKAHKAAIFNNLGVLYFKKQLFSYADEYFLKSEKLDKNNPVSVYNQLLIRMRLGNYLDAIDLISGRMWKLKDKEYWRLMMGLNYFLDGDQEHKLFNILKKIDDNSNESEFLRLADSYKSWKDNPELREDNLATLEGIQFQDPIWREAKNAFVARLGADVITTSKED